MGKGELEQSQCGFSDGNQVSWPNDLKQNRPRRCVEGGGAAQQRCNFTPAAKRSDTPRRVSSDPHLPTPSAHHTRPSAECEHRFYAGVGVYARVLYARALCYVAPLATCVLFCLRRQNTRFHLFPLFPQSQCPLCDSFP